MAKVVVAGNAVVVTSAMKLDDLKTIKKYRPKALNLMGGEDGKEVIFAISTEGKPGINEFGATFKDEARDGSELACITAELDYSGDDVKGYIADKFGGALININALEEILPGILQEIEVEKAAVMDQIALM